MIQAGLPFRPRYNGNGCEIPGSVGKHAKDVDFTGPKWKNTSKELRMLIRNLLQPHPEERLTVEETLKHIWITDSLLTLRKLYTKVLVKSNLI
jgi:serine/threonine protein kinase